jgi:uncharacterized repeat protein (TIGR01451 family)
MDPTMPRGLRRTISENDILALDLFGYAFGGPAPVRPVNDNFASPTPLTTQSGSINTTNVNATREAGEPLHAGYMGDKSVWYTWVSPVNGQATFDTIGSNFDTTLSVYLGPSITLLGTIAVNDDIVVAVDKVSRVQFNVVAGETYRIVIDGWNSENGNITLTWSATGAPPTPTPTPTPTPSPSPSPSPTPTPPADLAVDAFVASSEVASPDQFVTFVFVGHNNGPGIANNAQISVVLPPGLSFLTCSPSCTPPAGANGGTVTTSLGNLSPPGFVNFVVVAEVTASSGATLTTLAGITSATEDFNLSNNGASATIRVVDLVPFTEVKKLALHSEGAHVLALRRGTVWAWGHNFYGQLGDGTNIGRTSPVPVDDLMSVVDIEAGGNHSLALKSDGTVWSWGTNEHGELGIGSTAPSAANKPLKVVGLSGVTAIAAGSDYNLALKADGTVWGWGGNTIGQLGLGGTDFIAHTTPVQVPNLSGIVRIFAGDYVSYAVKADGTVFGWGNAFVGKLGDGNSGTPSINTPTELPALKGMVGAVTGVGSTVIFKADGTVYSFGSNFRGQLGRGLPDNGPYPVPAQIPGLLAKDVSNGDSFAIVTETSGTLKAFGRNDDGQLGFGGSDLLPHATPVTVPGIVGAFATVTGRQSTLALIGDPATGGTVRAWGGNTFGVLGIGSNGPSLNPTTVIENGIVARPNFSVAEGTITPIAVQIVCGTPASVIHYTMNGLDPTESDPVISSGSTVLVDHSLTLKARAFRTGFATSAVKSAAYTVVAATPPQLLIDQTGPAVDQLAALDVLTFLRDPFPVVNPNQLVNPPVDRNTRVAVFVTNLQFAQGEPASAVVVNIIGSNGVNYDLPAEVVGSVPNTDFTQITFRLPDTLAPGTCTIRVKFHAQTSNAGTVRIKG